jgi:hypothetical protein
MDELRSELNTGEGGGRRGGGGGAGAPGCAGRAPAAPYEGLLPTKEAAAQAVVDALAARDADRLIALAVSEVEFRENIYPALPASRPEVGMPVEYLWADTNLKSRGQLGQTLDEHGGRRLTVESVRFGGRATDYNGFRVHRDTWLTLRDDAGQVRDLRLFGSMVETSSGWKVYSYIVD